jgi:AP-1 complex subunit gamma-1
MSTSTPAAPVPAASQQPANPQRKAVDDILGLFGNTGATSSPAASTPPTAFSPTAEPSLFDAAPAPVPAAAAPAAPKVPTYNAYDKNGLVIQLAAKPGQPGQVSVLARFQVKGAAPAMGLNFQVAVPRTQQLQMSPMSSPDVYPGKTETQQMRIVAPPGVSTQFGSC